MEAFVSYPEKWRQYDLWVRKCLPLFVGVVSLVIFGVIGNCWYNALLFKRYDQLREKEITLFYGVYIRFCTVGREEHSAASLALESIAACAAGHGSDFQRFSMVSNVFSTTKDDDNSLRCDGRFEESLRMRVRTEKY